MSENPPAFPLSGEGPNVPYYNEGMTLRDWFATFAPQPTDDAIKLQHELDRSRNPHNEPYHNKPPIRSREQIIAALRYEYADAMLAERERQP